MEKDFNKVIEFLKEFGNKDFLGFLIDVEEENINEEYLEIVYTMLNEHDFKNCMYGVEESLALECYNEIKDSCKGDNFKYVMYTITEWEMKEQIDKCDVGQITDFLNDFEDENQKIFINTLKEISECISSLHFDVIEFVGNRVDTQEEFNKDIPLIKKLFEKGYGIEEAISYIDIRNDLKNDLEKE